MKNIYLLILLFTFATSVSAQKIITTINTTNRVDPYSIKYDAKTGAYIYNDYDSTTKKNVLITNTGRSKEYDYMMQYASLFDAAGNVYTSAFNNVTDTTYRYFFLKNGQEVTSYDFIGDGWAINNGILYFYAKDAAKAFIVSYNTASGEIKEGKRYDEIYLVNFPDEYYEGEPVGTMGFNAEGKPYYIALDNDVKFMVIGDEEQKKYADIDYYMFRTDLKGQPVYFAKSKGTFYVEKGNAFVVQGDKEYKAFDYLYGPVTFDKDNNPIYSASDSIGEYQYRSRIVTGNNEGKSYNGSIYEFTVTPSGKLAYVISESKKDKKTGEEIYESFVVTGDKEGKRFSSVSSLKFTDNDVPVYTASNKDNKYFVVKGDKIISQKYDNVYGYMFLKDGELAYVGSNYGNYEKGVPDKNFVHIGDKKFGPVEFVSMADYTTGSYILADRDKFAFLSGKLTSKEDYTYRYKVTTNDGESEEFDAIDQVKLINGKVVYAAGNFYDKKNYLYKYDVYVNNKPVAQKYDSIMELNYDKSTGKLTCIGCKDKSFYLLEFDL